MSRITCPQMVKLGYGLRDAVGAVIPLFRPDECANYFAAAGYEPD